MQQTNLAHLAVFFVCFLGFFFLFFFLMCFMNECLHFSADGRGLEWVLLNYCKLGETKNDGERQT